MRLRLELLKISKIAFSKYVFRITFASWIWVNTIEKKLKGIVLNGIVDEIDQKLNAGGEVGDVQFGKIDRGRNS